MAKEIKNSTLLAIIKHLTGKGIPIPDQVRIHNYDETANSIEMFRFSANSPDGRFKGEGEQTFDHASGRRFIRSTFTFSEGTFEFHFPTYYLVKNCMDAAIQTLMHLNERAGLPLTDGFSPAAVEKIKLNLQLHGTRDES